ncbi:MAG: alginate export family protein, partial [Gammaproteobacteria bacterium]
MRPPYWLLALPLLVAGSAFADDTTSFWDQLSDGDFSLDFRYRYEFVDDANFNKDAYASTLRTRMTYASPTHRGLSFLLQADNVSTIGNDLYNSTRNGVIDRPVVADPKGTEFDQAYLQWAGDRGTTLRLGRQYINRNNQRFIGTVGWRQNEQSYDAFGVGTDRFESFELNYAYVENVNRIFGPEDGVPSANFKSDSHWLDAKYSGWSQALLAGYAYLLDLENSP